MRTIAPALLGQLHGELLTSAICWKIVLGNGDVLRGTEWDEDITITVNPITGLSLTGDYLAGTGIGGSDAKSSGDFSVDNMEVAGAFQRDARITDITVEQLEAGLLSGAEVTVFLLDARHPDDGAYVIRYGNVGDIARNSDGAYTTEVRGLTQRLAYPIVDTYGDHCNVVRFGDARCTFNVAAHTITATVTAVTDRKHFTVSGFTTQPIGYFKLGILRGLTGSNDGFERTVKLDAVGGTQGHLELFWAEPFDVLVGDTFALEPGCDRAQPTCADVHLNIANFRGWGVFIPGVLAMMAGPIKGA